jgi:hypothetical protein
MQSHELAIPATQEAQTGGSLGEGQLGQQDPISKQKGFTWGVEHLPGVYEAQSIKTPKHKLVGCLGK